MADDAVITAMMMKNASMGIAPGCRWNRNTRIAVPTTPQSPSPRPPVRTPMTIAPMTTAPWSTTSRISIATPGTSMSGLTVAPPPPQGREADRARSGRRHPPLRGRDPVRSVLGIEPFVQESGDPITGLGGPVRRVVPHLDREDRVGAPAESAGVAGPRVELEDLERGAQTVLQRAE